MKTLLLSPDDIDIAAKLLKTGELVAFPTETVYGLGAVISNAGAIAKIFSTKGRPQNNPLIVHIASLDEVDDLAIEIPPVFYTLAKAYWPGPLTLILQRKPSVSSGVSAELDTIALRMPRHPLARALIEKVGEPLAAPSANLSGKPSSTSAQHVCEDFEGKIAAILDGGICEGGIESTVISLVFGEKPLLLRPGSITKEEIEKVLGSAIEVHAPKKGERPLSPGMAYRHYAPKAPIKLFEVEKELLMHLRTAYSKKRMILSNREIPGHKTWALSQKTLYALLRQSDREGCEEVLILIDEELQHDRALTNRVFRASSSN